LSAPVPTPLAGHHILVTRPPLQALALTALIEAAGGQVMALPTLDTRPVAPDTTGRAALDALPGYDLAIFISANAVQHARAWAWPWPAAVPAYAVGTATAAALRSADVARVCVPVDGADSEALLRMPALVNAQGKRIVIFRGLGGREVLARSLGARGARVDYVECYERFIPPVEPASVIALCQEGLLHAVCISSAQGLENLTQIVGPAGWACLRALPHFVIHPRIMERARALGVTEVITCDASDTAIVNALVAHFNPTQLASQ